MEILKICENCGETYKPFSDKRNNQRFCCKRCREKKWAQENRERLCANVRAYRARRYKNNGKWLDNGKKAKENKEWMIELKSKPCVDCGNTFPICCMDFDHKEGEIKKYNIGTMFAHHYGRELILEELEKCELVCANCHRIRTQKRRTGSGKH